MTTTQDINIKTVEQFEELIRGRTIESVYNGRTGCCCGCLGTHSKTPRSIKLALTKARRLLAEGEVGEFLTDIHPCLAFEHGEETEPGRKARTFVIYFA